MQNISKTFNWLKIIEVFGQYEKQTYKGYFLYKRKSYDGYYGFDELDKTIMSSLEKAYNFPSVKKSEKIIDEEKTERIIKEYFNYRPIRVNILFFEMSEDNKSYELVILELALRIFKDDDQEEFPISKIVTSIKEGVPDNDIKKVKQLYENTYEHI